ncbi:MAG: hypothetical protein ACKVQV_05540 [Bacteroidia bacterium]
MKTKFYISIFFCLFTFILKAQEIDDLSSLTVSFTGREQESYGDYSFPSNSELRFAIKKDKNRYYAYLTNSFYVGTIKEEAWRQEIDNDILISIQNFIKNIDTIPIDLHTYGYLYNDYSISYLKRTWSLHLDMVTDPVEFEKLYKTIFSKQITLLKEKRKKFRTKTENQLSKKWYFDSLALEKLKIGSVLILSSKQTDLQTYYWQFSDSLRFSENRNDILTNKRNAKLEYFRGRVHLLINLDNDPKSINPAPYYNFEIIALTKNELKLKVFYHD